MLMSVKMGHEYMGVIVFSILSNFIVKMKKRTLRIIEGKMMRIHALKPEQGSNPTSVIY